MYSGPIRVHTGPRYQVDSWGNGAAYALTRISDGASCFFQGDDANIFRAELDADVETAYLEGTLLSAYDDIMTVEACK